MVGPESAGAHPGPACYRKGKSWYLPRQAPSHAAQAYLRPPTPTLPPFSPDPAAQSWTPSPAPNPHTLHASQGAP